MRRLLEEPSYGLALSDLTVLATELHENRRAFPNEFAVPRRARAVIACPTSIALPARRAPPPATGPPDNQKACRDSLFRTWKASRHRSPHAMMKSKISAYVCSVRRRQYNRSGGRKRSQRGAAPRSDLASCVGRPRCVRGGGDHFSPAYFAGNRTTDRVAVRCAKQSTDRFSPRRQPFQSPDCAKLSCVTDQGLLDRIDRYRPVVCRLQFARIDPPWVVSFSPGCRTAFCAGRVESREGSATETALETKANIAFGVSGAASAGKRNTGCQK